MLLLIPLALLGTGLVGLVRGRADSRYIVSRWRSLAAALVGLALLFAVTAPPTAAVPGLGAAARFEPPPALAADEARLVAAAWPSDKEEGVQPEQVRAFQDWERDLKKRFKAADKALEQAAAVFDAALSGKLDRFTAWVRLGVIGQDMKQAGLTVRHATPSRKLDMEHQRAIQERVIAPLERAIDARRKAIHSAQAFFASQRLIELESLEKALGRAGELQAEAVEAWIETRRAIGAPE